MKPSHHSKTRPLVKAKAMPTPSYWQWLVIATGLMVLTLLLPKPAFAEDNLQDVYSLNAVAKSPVANDLMRVVLTAHEQTNEPAEASLKVNRDMNWAFTILEGLEKVSAKTLNYQTNPVYKNQKVVGWRVSQQLELTSENFDQLSAIVGKLQDRLTVQTMGFAVSDDAQLAAEDLLIERALNQYRDRAQLVASTMGASRFRILSAHINTSGNFHPPLMMRQMESSFVSKAVPAVEGGTSDVTVTVDGQVQLIFD